MRCTNKVSGEIRSSARTATSNSHAGGQEDRHAAIFECAPKKIGPAPAAVGFHPRFRQNLRNVDREFVRRRVHARVIAGAAVVAKVGKIKNVACLEITARLDGAKDGTVTLAVTARVADDQLAAGLLNDVKPCHLPPPPCPLACRTRSRWSARSLRGSLWSEYFRT